MGARKNIMSRLQVESGFLDWHNEMDADTWPMAMMPSSGIQVVSWRGW